MNNVLIKSVPELIDRLLAVEGHWIYRGHGNADGLWSLGSSLERVVGNCNDEPLRRYEIYSTELFQTKAHHHLKYDEKPRSKLAWLSLMQHHGVKTRLLDFTGSPFIALFFAVNSMKVNQSFPGSIYALNRREVMKGSIAALNEEFPPDPKLIYPPLPSLNDEIYEKYILKTSRDIIWVTEPSTENLRLSRQQGCFVFTTKMSSTITKTIEANYTDSDKLLMRFDFDSKLLPKINEMLDKMNLNYESLYCDLDGLSRDISIKMDHFAEKFGHKLRI